MASVCVCVCVSIILHVETDRWIGWRWYVSLYVCLLLQLRIWFACLFILVRRGWFASTVPCLALSRNHTASLQKKKKWQRPAPTPPFVPWNPLLEKHQAAEDNEQTNLTVLWVKISSCRINKKKKKTSKKKKTDQMERQKRKGKNTEDIQEGVCAGVCGCVRACFCV